MSKRQGNLNNFFSISKKSKEDNSAASDDAIITTSELAKETEESSHIDQTSDLGEKHECPMQPVLKKFPYTATGNKRRAFTKKWYEKKWLEYSCAKDAVFCYPCRFFQRSTASKETTFTVEGYRDWKNIGNALAKHGTSDSHLEASAFWEDFKRSGCDNAPSISQNLAKGHDKIVSSNRDYLIRIVDSLLLLVRQGQGIRGHNEGENSSNRGNFLELLDFLTKYDPVFSKKKKTLSAREQYSSPEVQNEIINICGKQVLDNIRNDIQSCLSTELDCQAFLCILCDESRDISNQEQLSICLRYVTSDLIIKEEFVGFNHLKTGLTAVDIFQSIIMKVSELRLDNCAFVAQCYDGASVMSGCNNGVQNLFREKHPHAVYTHCYAHKLNLVLLESTKNNAEARNFFSLLETLYVFISNSTPIHEKFVALQKAKQLQVRELKKLCDTRWACRYQSVNVIHKRFDVIIELLTFLAEESFNSEMSVTAAGLINKIMNYKFIALLEIFIQILSITNGLNEHLQKKDLNLANAAKFVETVKSTLKSMRENDWQTIWSSVSKRCEMLELKIENQEKLGGRGYRFKKTTERSYEVFMMSTGQKQIIHKDPETEMRIDVFLPCLDKIIYEMNRRFSPENIHILNSVQSLLNPADNKFMDFETIDPFLKLYSGCLKLDTGLLKAEMRMAREISTKMRCDSPQIKDIMLEIRNICPNLLQVVSLALTLPVTSAACERSFSAMKYIKNYLRSTMSSERLSSLSVLYCNNMRTSLLDLDAVVDVFGRSKQRNIKFF